MLEIKKYGAIDIGSNAIRLLITNVIIQNHTNPEFKKSSLVRVPIRLGADAFVSGVISKKNTKRLIDAIKAFKLLMKVSGVTYFKACATSAMRDAKNNQEIVAKIYKKTGIQIDIIDGKKEAAIIFSTDLKELIKYDTPYLYIDVGGGSTELTVFSKGKIINSKSFKIGTIRLMNNKTSENKLIFKQLENWVKLNTQHLNNVSLIGSGGSINKIFKMSEIAIGQPLSYTYLYDQYQLLKKMSYQERIVKLGLNPDRADVIVFATKIYLSTMKWSGAKKIFVPKIGLSDGIIKELYHGNF